MYLPICYFLHFYGQKKKMSACEKLAKFMMLTVTLAVIKMLSLKPPNVPSRVSNLHLHTDERANHPKAEIYTLRGYIVNYIYLWWQPQYLLLFKMFWKCLVSYIIEIINYWDIHSVNSSILLKMGAAKPVYLYLRNVFKFLFSVFSEALTTSG